MILFCFKATTNVACVQAPKTKWGIRERARSGSDRAWLAPLVDFFFQGLSKNLAVVDRPLIQLNST